MRVSLIVHALISFSDNSSLAGGGLWPSVCVADGLVQEVGVLKQLAVNQDPRNVLMIRRSGLHALVLNSGGLTGSAGGHGGPSKARGGHVLGKARGSISGVAFVLFHAKNKGERRFGLFTSGDVGDVVAQLVHGAHFVHIRSAFVSTMLAGERTVDVLLGIAVRNHLQASNGFHIRSCHCLRQGGGNELLAAYKKIIVTTEILLIPSNKKATTALVRQY
jgi:hypothetical protein